MPNATLNRDRRIIENPYLRWAAISATLIGLAVFFVSQRVVWSSFQGREFDFQSSLSRELLYWAIWAPLIPIILACVRRYPLEPGSIKRTFWPNLALSVVVATTHEVVYQGLISLVIQGSTVAEALQHIADRAGAIPGNAFTGFYKFWLMLIIYAGADYYGRYRDERKRAANLLLANTQLEADLRQAQLETLKMQLQPHFLFNTLNTISFLMKEDVPAANNMLLRFSELLRISLDEATSATTSLHDEVEFIRRYLEIEELRFQDRFNLTIDISQDVLDAQVPFMIMQPIVENAMQHGIERSANSGAVSVRAYRAGGRVVVEIEDDGPGFSGVREQDPSKHAGLGLANTQARLEKMFDGNTTFEMLDAEPAGALVKFSFPYTTTEDSQ